jgi:hypothetical protein
MALDTTSFLIVLAIALVGLGIAAWLIFHFDNKRRQ